METENYDNDVIMPASSEEYEPYEPVGEVDEVEDAEVESEPSQENELDEGEIFSAYSDDEDDTIMRHHTKGSKRMEAKDSSELPWDDYNKHPLVLREDNAMPHQKEAIQVGQVKLKKHGCFLLADDPGLGKTRMTLELLSLLLQLYDKVLLVVPRSLDSTWVTQLKRHFKAPYPNILMLDSKITEHQVDQAQIVIATVQMLMNCTDYVPEPSIKDIDAWYDHKTSKARSKKERDDIVEKIDASHSAKEIKDQAKRWLKAQKRVKLFKSAGLKKFNQVQWTVTVLDEGHKIRNKDTGGNKVMRDLGKKTLYRMSLTGTVFNNAGEELWAYLITLRPSGTDAEANEYMNRVRKTTGIQYALEGLWMDDAELQAKNEAEKEKPEEERLVYSRIEIDFEAIPVPKSENVVFRKLWKTKVQPGFESFAIYNNDHQRTKCCAVQRNPHYQVLGEDEEEQPGVHNEFVFVGKLGHTKDQTYHSFVAFAAAFTGHTDLSAAECYNHFYVTHTVKIWALYYRTVQDDQLRGLSKTDQEKRSKKIANIKKKIRAGALSLPVETILRIIGIRRQKGEVNLKLAKKTINDVIVNMSEKQYLYYKAVEEIESRENNNKYLETLRLLQCGTHPIIPMYSAQNPKGEAVLNKKYSPRSYPAKSSINRGLQYPEDELTPKLIAVSKILQKIRSDDPTAKSLVLTHSVRLVSMLLLDYLQQTFGPNSVAIFNGTLDNNKRKKEMERFKTDPECTILLMVDSMAVGLDIPEATNVLIVEHQWNPANEQQSMDRVHRIGQTKDVFIYRFISTWPADSPEMQKRKEAQEGRFAQSGPMTMDEKVVNRLLTKREALGQYDAEKYMGVLKTEVTTVKQITSKVVRHETRTLPAPVDQPDLVEMLQQEEEYVQQSDEDESTDEPARKKIKLYN